MKKLFYMLAGMFIIAVLISCEKEKMDDRWDGQAGFDNSSYIKSAADKIASTPESDADIVPYIIAGANRGGNRTCEEVATAFETTFASCGVKLNYGDFDFDGDNEFDGFFPQGLEVTVEGNYVSFRADNCIIIDGISYKVGAVIVKGSNSANVYYYPNGTYADAGLAAPGGSKMVSNLTFCFVQCENPLVIAVKSILTGEVAFTVDATQTETLIDYYLFVNGDNGKIFLNGDITKPVGNISVTDSDSDGLLEVTIDNVDMPAYLFKYDTYLFVGLLSDFNAITDHYGFPYHISANPATTSVTIDLPF